MRGLFHHDIANAAQKQYYCTHILVYGQTTVFLNKRTVSIFLLFGVWRRYGHGQPEESDEDFDARWLAYFNQPDLDAWDLKKGLNELYGHDLVPEPKIVVAMLQAARRVNDIALAIRILEAVKSKAVGDKELHSE